MENLTQFISFYGLSEKATTQDILAAMQSQSNQNRDLKSEVEKLKHENSAFQNQLITSQKEKIKDLVDSAIKSQRITEEQRSTYTLLAEANYDATKVALNAITPYKSITSQLQSASADALEYKTFREYQQHAPEALAQLKTENPEKYLALYKKQFGKNSKLNQSAF